MQAEHQKLSVSISEIKQNLSIPIIKVITIPHLRHNYYHAVTSFGSMCLVVQTVHIDMVTWIHERNQFMAKHFKCFPLIFEQKIIEKSDIQALCLTLMENCSSLESSVMTESFQIKLTNFPKLIMSLQLIEQNSITLQSKQLSANFIYLNNSQQISLDFTVLRPLSQQQSVCRQQNLLNFIIGCLQRRFNPSHRICEVIFIKGQIFTFQPKKLTQARDYTELLIFINMYPNQELDLVSRNASDSSPTKTKKVKIKQLEGNPLVSIKRKQYSEFQFLDGKCINCLRQIFYEQLSTKFIHENSLYKLQQFQHLVVHAFPNTSKSQQEQTILVYPPVSKVQLISFLIAYVKCVNPTLNSIEYLALQNTLKLRFINRKNQEKVLRMVFYQEYLVKDEELSMIIEKSNIKNGKLSLIDMKISDSFLIFLSHSQKTKQINEFHLTDNPSLSEVGLITLLRSPNSANLNSFSLTVNSNNQTNILEESIEQIGKKQSLRHLYLNKLSSTQVNQIDMSSLNLVQLQCFGVRITLSNLLKQSLKILRLDQKVNIEQLASIRHLKLIELKICIVEIHKKSLMDSISGFSSLASSLKFNNKVDQVQQFASGQCKRTLKKIDLSNSHCKFKTLRPLLLMSELESIKLDNCINIGTEFDPISPKILQGSFVGMEANLQNFMAILRNCRQLIELNIANTRISKQQIGKLVDKLTLHISNLIINEKQFSNKLLETEGSYGLIQCIQIYIDRMLEQQQEYSFNLLISKASSSPKTVRFIFSPTEQTDKVKIEIKKQLFMSRINKYLIMSSANLEQLDNLYVNKTKIIELLEIQQDFSVQDFCESQVASSIEISADKCKIVSEPKIIMQKNSNALVIFKALKKQTIDKFTHRYAKFIKQNQLPVCVDLSNNKLIGKQIVDLCLSFSTELVREVDFRGCMFDLDDTIDSIFHFPELTQINAGECSVLMTRQNFASRSQSYLKLFMRLKSVTKLKIKCYEIEQGQILYSVLTHIVDKSSSTLKELSITLTRMTLNLKIINFMQAILNLSKLTGLECIIEDCEIEQYSLEIWQKKLNNLKQLQNLKLSLPPAYFPIVSLTNLTKVNLEFTDGQLDQQMANKCIKNLYWSKSISQLRISFANSSHISNISRVFGILPVGNIFDKLPCLEQLFLNFEYCSLKEQTLFELVGSLTRCSNLRTLQLNVSFAVHNFTEFLNCIEHCFEQFSKPINLKIISVTSNSSAYLLQIQNLTQKGVEFII